MSLTIDSSRPYRWPSELVELVEAVTRTDPNTESTWTEWKSILDLNDRSGLDDAPHVIIRRGQRSPGFHSPTHARQWIQQHLSGAQLASEHAQVAVLLILSQRVRRAHQALQKPCLGEAADGGDGDGKDPRSPRNLPCDSGRNPSSEM
jgi:hypothetical protein